MDSVTSLLYWYLQNSPYGQSIGGVVWTWLWNTFLGRFYVFFEPDILGMAFHYYSTKDLEQSTQLIEYSIPDLCVWPAVSFGATRACLRVLFKLVPCRWFFSLLIIIPVSLLVRLPSLSTHRFIDAKSFLDIFFVSIPLHSLWLMVYWSSFRIH